jgi:hypothetical protein
VPDQDSYPAASSLWHLAAFSSWPRDSECLELCLFDLDGRRNEYDDRDLTSRDLMRVHDEAIHLRGQLHTSVVLPDIEVLPLLQR